MGEIRERMRKVVIFTVKGCYRSICNHPFVVGMLCFLVVLYRSYPFMFSLLVSASPVIACTAILLGTLLSFGKPNIPEIEREVRTTHGIVSLKTGVFENNVVLDRDESVSVEKYGDKEEDVVDVVGKLVKDSVENEICLGGSDGSFGRLLDKRSKETEFDDRVQEERRREFVDVELGSRSELFEERLGDGRIAKHRYSLIPDVDDENDLENDRSPTGSVDSKAVNFDSLDSPPCTPWRHVNQENEEENEDDKALDSGSDRAESSSPDASMADILPVLDELHPLLDEDAPRPLNLSHDGSDAASEQSGRSDESSNESDDDTEKEVSEVEENDKDGENEEETHEEEDQTKSAITWTEEDERNLMDLGTSELERNQRLENLIARRTAQKTPSLAPETNLIDLESTDFLSNVPPILTTRNNPFDLSQDSYKDMGLPPIPGSAPSVLLHRRNPFDIPYELSEEKPDLEEDSFQQDFTPFQSKEHFVRRHESFNAWRTPFRNNRPEKKDTSRFRPYFVAESLGSEGTSYSHFQRQLSGISDSIASSVPDTGSIGSSEESERWNVSEEGSFAIEDRNNVGDDITRELDLITRAEYSNELDQFEKRPLQNDETYMKLVDTEEAESSLVAEQRLANQFKITLAETYSNVEDHEQRYRNISSSSSLSEESERIYVEKEVEEYPSFIDEIYQHEEPRISAPPSLRCSHLNITSPLGDDSFHRDPVYEFSPLDVNESLSRSSFRSDLASSVIKKSVSFSEIVTDIGSPEQESDAIAGEEKLFGDIQHIDDRLSQAREVPTCPESIAVPPEVFGSRAVDELDEIEEFDEELLEELDTVGDFSVNEFREVDHHIESGCKVSRVQHDAESSLTVFEEKPTQVHASEQVVHPEKLSATIKEFDQHDDDIKHVSEFEIYRSPADPIDPLQYDGIGYVVSGFQSSEALGFSEDGTVEDVQADLDFQRELKSGVEESDVQKTMQNSNEESDMVEAKSSESDDALISERKFLNDSFSALQQESQSSPSETLKMSDDVRVNTHSPQEAKSGADDYDEKRTQQIFLEEPYSSEAKTPKSHDALISEIQPLDDSDLALKLESSSLSEALKSFEDGLPASVQADTNSRRETKLGVEESDVKETYRTSLEEPNFVEVKTPACHDASETASKILT